MDFDITRGIAVLECTPGTLHTMLHDLDTAWLPDAELALDGEHPQFGAVTLRQLLATWVVRDSGHIAQTARVMAKQYRDPIGPWRAYLPIVNR